MRFPDVPVGTQVFQSQLSHRCSPWLPEAQDNIKRLPVTYPGHISAKAHPGRPRFQGSEPPFSHNISVTLFKSRVDLLRTISVIAISRWAIKVQEVRSDITSQLPKLKTAPLATLLLSGIASAESTNREDQTEWMELPTRMWKPMNIM